MKQNIGIVIYDKQSHSAESYLKAFKEYYRNSDYSFESAWSNVNELIDVLQDQGSSSVNSLSRIVVFDEGFIDQDDVVGMMTSFISLEEVMVNKGIEKPILFLATANQEFYDMFKKQESPEGHDVFYYPNTKVYRIPINDEGSIQLATISKIISGQADEQCLSIKNTYQGRESLARNQIAAFKEQKLNEKAAQIDEISEKIKQHADEYKKKQTADDLDKEIEKKANADAIVDVDPEESLLHKDDVVETKDYQIPSKKLPDDLNYQSKLISDAGHLVIAGKTGSGESSFVFNLANLYGMMNKKVLILNLADNDHLVNYLFDYQSKYQDLNRKQVLMTDYSKSLKEICIPLNSYIDVISDIGYLQQAYDDKERFKNYEKIMNNSNEYDIVLVNVGDKLDKLVQCTNASHIDSILFVSTMDELNDIGNDLIDNLITFNSFVQDNIKNKQIGYVINRLPYFVSNSEMEQMISKLRPPFDEFELVGIIPEDNQWSLQKYSKIPIINHSSEMKSIFQSIATNIVY